MVGQLAQQGRQRRRAAAPPGAASTSTHHGADVQKAWLGRGHGARKKRAKNTWNPSRRDKVARWDRRRGQLTRDSSDGARQDPGRVENHVHGGTGVEVNVWDVINLRRWRENRGVINLEDLNLTEGETSCGEGTRSSQVASWQLATAAAAHGFAGASICGARTAQAGGSTTRRKVRLERGRGAQKSAQKKQIPIVVTTRREGRSVLELAEMAHDAQTRQRYEFLTGHAAPRAVKA